MRHRITSFYKNNLRKVLITSSRTVQTPTLQSVDRHLPNHLIPSPRLHSTAFLPADLLPSSTPTPPVAETPPPNPAGEEYYLRAKQHLQNHERAQVEQEESNRQEQYQKPDDTDSSGRQSKRPGIAVVKTIAKQTRTQQQQKHLNHHPKQQDHPLSEWDKAQECMQIAAFVHGHLNAIVSLANRALTTPKFDAEKEYRFVTHALTKSPSDTTIDTIVPMEVLMGMSGAKVAEKLYETAGRRGSKEGWFNLGHLYWMGHDPDVAPDQELGLECFENAVDLGDDDARYFLSVHYLAQQQQEQHSDTEEDEAVEELRKRGLMLLQEAGDYGHVGALYYLALMYRNGDVGLDIEPCMILYQEYLDEAADGGDGDALFLRAHCMYTGEDGYEVDRKSALECFLEAGEAGNADGFVSAGAIYHNGGVHVKQDQRKAFELYQQAGELGSAEGWRNVVACYALGEGVPKCEETARYISKTMLNDGQR